jgi:hypothetical protein
MTPQHAGGCAAMMCKKCQADFCLWCRTVTPLRDNSVKARHDANNATHTHIWTCGKRPSLEQICTTSVMFPVRSDDPQGLPDDDDFLPFFFKARKLQGLATMITQGDMTIMISHTLTFVPGSSSWSVQDIQRLVFNPNFQSILKHLKEAQVKMHEPFHSVFITYDVCARKSTGRDILRSCCSVSIFTRPLVLARTLTLMFRQPIPVGFPTSKMSGMCV